MIAILDYEAGNQTSVKRALDSLRIPCTVTADPQRIASSSGLIFPGVGAAGQAMRHLQSTGLDRLLKQWAGEGKPLLGVCLGCQILLEKSEENSTATLGLLPGCTRRFDKTLREENSMPISIPHMGWNAVRRRTDCPLFSGIPAEAEFYFVHSYYVQPQPEYVIGTTYYGMEFCSFFGRDGLWAAQFHIEKSGRAGLRMLENFHTYCQERTHA